MYISYINQDKNKTIRSQVNQTMEWLMSEIMDKGFLKNITTSKSLTFIQLSTKDILHVIQQFLEMLSLNICKKNINTLNIRHMSSVKTFNSVTFYFMKN